VLDVFNLRRRVIEEYAAFSRSFTRIAAADIASAVAAECTHERYWPEPLVQIKPNYERNGTVGDLVRQGFLHSACEAIFQADKLCYILDPASVMRSDYPSETFRLLKTNEDRELGEYRTRRLVLEPWERLANGDLR
jgi:hypothetical protein